MQSPTSELLTNPARVLVVDDEAPVRVALTRYLNLLGYRAAAATSGYQAMEMLECTPYDAMVLDIRMPGMDGIEVLQQARQRYPDLCIILLTGYASLESAIAAVRSHADDYLLKPASARGIIRSITRALGERAQESPSSFMTSDRFLRAGLLTLDRERHRVAVVGSGDEGNVTVQLTNSQSALLEHLMQHPDTVLSCRELAQEALGYDVSEDEAQKIVRPHICRLRQKIEPDPGWPRLIRTVPGEGYRLAVLRNS